MRRTIKAFVRTLVPTLVVAFHMSVVPGGDLTAQETGRIVGRVQDLATGRSLAAARVYLADESQGVITDLNGRFVLTVPIGPHAVVAQMLGYTTKTVTGVEVGSQVADLVIGLQEAALQVEGITVTAEAERGSSTYLLDQRRTSTALVEAVGSTEIRRRPDSDAAEVARRMTGVTVSDENFVYVRGLGDRYSQTSLNGSSLPSPEPEKEVVPLDLFPSSFLESLQTQKSYTPDLPADFSGGNVRINTKDFPSELSVRFGIGSSFNTLSAFQDNFLTTHGGETGFFGTDNGSRQLPKTVRDLLGGIRGQPLPSDGPTRVAVAEAFRQQAYAFMPVAGETPQNRSFDASIGASRQVLDDGEMGFVLAGTYSDQYAIRDREEERKYFTTAFDPDTPDELRLANVDYEFQRGTRNISWGTLGNFSFKPSPTQKVSLRTTANLSTEEEARVFEGLNSEDIGGQIRSTRARFVERLLLWGQLSGEHQAFWGSRFDWRATMARAHRDEPYLREAIYVEDDDEYLLLSGDTSGRLFWSDLTDDDRSAEFDWRVPFELAGEDASVKFGGAYRDRAREFGARRFRFDFLGSLITDIDQALADAEMVESVTQAGEFSIRERPEPGDRYDVRDARVAGYVMFEVPLSATLQAVAGARVETYDLNLSTLIADRDTILADRKQTDVAPAVSLIWSPSPSIKLRVGGSRTADRPEFRELAPFQFTEATSLRQVIGNPDLEPADILSADLRADWFPAPGELLSAGVFVKRLDQPIELVYLGAASTAYRFTNAVDATLVGVELDATLMLDRLHGRLADFTWQGNFSLIESDVTVERRGAFNPTNTERPLVGQAPYVLNTGVTWATLEGWEAGVFLNRFGRRLEAASGEGVPDIYEEPRNVVDATLAFPLPGNVRAKLKGSNLLNSPYRFVQSANGITLVQRMYEVGTTLSVGLSWEF